MNVYAVVILTALLVNYGLNLVTNLLNLRRLGEPLPDEFKDVFDEERYRKSQAYTRERTKFGLLASSVDLLVLIGFWFAGGFAFVDDLVRSLNLGMIPTGLLYFLILALASWIVSLPFSIYETFVIEQRFGFNRTTVRTFILDLLKGALLALVLGGPILAAVLWFFAEAGPYAWVYAWAAVTVFGLLIQYVAPRYLLPLFNKFEPLPQGELRDAILSYASKVHFPIGEIYVMDGSRRSSKSNAFFTGFGRNRRIVLYDTLVEKHTTQELLAVFAHEVGHYKKKHILQSLAISFVHTGFLFFLLSFFLRSPGLFEAFYVDDMSVYAGLLFFGLLYTPVELLLSIPLQMLSRKHEYEADRYAVRTTRLTEAFVQALKKLSEHNLSNLNPHPAYVFLNYSHPPLRDRIAALRRATRDSSEVFDRNDTVTAT